MAHNIFNSRFYGNRKPAWHGLGVVNDIDQTATETLRLLGEYTVEKRPVHIQLNGELVQDGYYRIVRTPTPDDPIERVWGFPVRDRWQLITPQDVVQLYDENLKNPETGEIAPVETMGMLGKGERIFVSTKLPMEFDVKGDEMLAYLLLDNPMIPGYAVTARVTSIRVVCQNTLMMSEGNFMRQYRIPHTVENLHEKIGNWMREAYLHSLTTASVMQEAFEVLANKQVTDVDVRWLNNQVFPDPVKPEFDPFDQTPFETRLMWFEAELSKTQSFKEAVLHLFQGDGTGINTPAANGTAFGWLNVVSEALQYKQTSNFRAAAADMVVGTRQKQLEKAYVLARQFATS